MKIKLINNITFFIIHAIEQHMQNLNMGMNI